MIKSADEFVALRTSSQPEEYLKAAKDEPALEVWLEVLQRFPEMKVWVVRNKSVPAEILAMLSCDSDPGIRAAVASKNKLPRELMDLLASDLDESVRHRIVFNKNASAGVLEKLSTDSSSMVAESARAKLASRPQSS